MYFLWDRSKILELLLCPYARSAALKRSVLFFAPVGSDLKRRIIFGCLSRMCRFAPFPLCKGLKKRPIFPLWSGKDGFIFSSLSVRGGLKSGSCFFDFALDWQLEKLGLSPCFFPIQQSEKGMFCGAFEHLALSLLILSYVVVWKGPCLFSRWFALKRRVCFYLRCVSI